MNASVANVLIEALAALDAELTAAQAKVDRLTLERQGVAAALKRFGYTPSTSPATPGPAAHKEPLPSEARSTAYTSRVLDLLQTAGAPLRGEDIAERLDLTVAQVRSAVAYLHRKHRVINVKRGYWQAITDTERVSANTETLSGTTHSIMKGGGANGTGFDRVYDDSSSWRAEQCVPDHRARVGG